jgi:hypothetical protein
MVTGMSISAKNYSVEESDVDYWLTQFDEDKGGSIGEEEFVKGMARWVENVSPKPPPFQFLLAWNKAANNKARIILEQTAVHDGNPEVRHPLVYMLEGTHRNEFWRLSANLPDGPRM